MKIKKYADAAIIASSCLLGLNYTQANGQNFDKKILPYNGKRQIENTIWTTKEQIFLCLEVDSPETFTHTKTLETIPDDDEVIVEFPLNQIISKTYNGKPHPLAVTGISKTFGSLIGTNNVSEFLSAYPQKLTDRAEEITSKTKYEASDTLRFSLKNPLLDGCFPDKLSNQLKEPGFEKMSNPDSLIIDDLNKNKYGLTPMFIENEKHEYVYDVVIKKLDNGKSALAVYRNGNLFMTTYVSVGLPRHETLTGKFDIITKQPYKRSKKYDNSPMSFGLMFDYGGFYIHQGKVNGKPASHGCVRLPGVYASILYSLVKDKDHTDIFIDKNLYK